MIRSRSRSIEAERWPDAAAATALGDTIAPDPEEVWLSRLRDATLLVLGVVAHAHGASAKEIRRATGQLPGRCGYPFVACVAMA